MDLRIRSIHDQVKAACLADAARNVRFRTPVPRHSYMVLRVEGADALDVGRLVLRNRDCLFYIRSIGGEAALDVYIPMGRTPTVVALRFVTNLTLLGAAAAATLAVWTMAATKRRI